MLALLRQLLELMSVSDIGLHIVGDFVASWATVMAIS